jgi:hypothetical protein
MDSSLYEQLLELADKVSEEIEVHADKLELVHDKLDSIISDIQDDLLTRDMAVERLVDICKMLY